MATKKGTGKKESKKQSSQKPRNTVKKQTARTTQASFETRDPMSVDNGPPMEAGSSSPGAWPRLPQQYEPSEKPTVSDEIPEDNEPLPKYQDGCPECHERSLVTELKIRSWRQCRCRECGWRGEMED